MNRALPPGACGGRGSNPRRPSGPRIALPGARRLVGRVADAALQAGEWKLRLKSRYRRASRPRVASLANQAPDDATWANCGARAGVVVRFGSSGFQVG